MIFGNMQEHITLYDLFDRCSSASFRVIYYYDDLNKHILTSSELYKSINKISTALTSVSASKSVVCCLFQSNLLLPSVILGILKVSSSFAFLDIRNPLLSLQNLQKYVPISTIFIEDILLENFKSQLCACWEKKSNEFLMKSKICILQSSNCSADSCSRSRMLYKNFQKHSSQLAYIMQTSGTTGEPKIVQVPHHCIVPNILDLRSRFSVKPDDVILQCTALTFDPSIIEIFLAASSGSALVIIPHSLRSMPKKLMQVIEDAKITILQCTPSFIQCFEDDLIKNTLLKKDSTLRILALGGEICPSWKKLQNRRAEGNKTRFFNLYGLTEISCWATSFEIDPKNPMLTSSIPLGNPLLDTKLEIRNEAGNISEEGELYIGGENRWCVINDEKWPENVNNIMRPTGDIVYSANDGLLYFEGRNDSIIKYKGQKLCLSLVDSALESVPEVANHVIYFNQTLKKLSLFVRCNLKRHSSSNQIRKKIMLHLRKSIFNLPAVEVVFVPYFPLTMHGKTDYKKLLEMSTWEQLPIVENTCNINCEELVSSLWKAYTGQQSVADEDNFALNGGNSSLAVQMASDIEKKLQLSIPVLVQKLLNNNYHDVVELLKSSLQSQYKSLIKFERTMENTQDDADEPPNKKKLEILCHELSCKRGYYFNCMHLKISCCREKETFPRILDTTVTLKYKIDLKKCVDASPCIVHFLQSEEMLIFIGSHSGTFCAITAENGTVKWSIQLPDRIESSSCLSYCGKYVLVGCYDYHFYCFDLKKGAVTWKYKTGAEVKSSPVVSCSNVAFVGSHDKHLYAVNVETGYLEWKKEISKGSIFSSPAVVEQLSSVCVATLDGTISMLKMVSGEVIWTYHYGKPVFSSPSITLTSIFVGSTDNSMLHFDLSGNMVSKYHTCGPVFSSACIISSQKCETIVFGCDDCYIYCINSQGECIWKTQCDSSIYATPFTFQWLNQTCIVVASTSGTLYILKEDNGEVLQSWKVPGKVFSSPVVLNNVLTFGSRDNNVYIYNL